MSYVIGKNALSAFLASSAIGLGVMLVGATSPAQAANAPWCLYKDGGYLECAYLTAEQCLYSARGQGGTCNVNSAYSGGYAQYAPNSPRTRRGFY
jgi:hypothetical protein